MLFRRLTVFDRACVANIMIIYYTTLMSGSNADVSYNTAWLGCWVYAEICLGIIVTCMISLPKFVEEKGGKVVQVFVAVIKPLRSFSSLTTLVRPAKTDSFGLDGAIEDRASGDEICSETELVCHAHGHNAGSYPWEQTIAMKQERNPGSTFPFHCSFTY